MSLTIVEILNKYRVEHKIGGTHHHVRAQWVGVDCPKCSPSSGRYRLGFDTTSRRANCWVCGRCDPLEMLAAVCRIETGEAFRLWNQRGFDPTPRAERQRGDLKEPSGIGDLLPQHRRYLMQRGFDPAAVERTWGVRGIGIAPRLAWRLYIPIYDRDGGQVSWTTRSISPEAEQRYISASADEEIVSHKTVLYGAHLCRSTVVAVEGPTDVWAIGPGAAGTLGVGCTAAQIMALAQFPVRYTCFDNEPDAQRRADDICEELSAYPGHTENLVLETGSDPATADPAEVAELRSRFLE